ncbi:ABC transporter ATP-binding protein [Halomarina halobia]|uniref:ABC transporter ATP-binding protein n=1 Tax=Halomarina halobia TaxID=3033386 RepID=A0ABD6ADZ5_9EURY|nr:ABC transporter ATP-binding protein [Halomarina sp. PSR21]
MTEPLLEAEDLTVQYRTSNGLLTAVSDASFTIEEGQYFGLVGESGCGKSTIIKAILGGLDDNGRITSGKIKYRGEEIQDLSDEERNRELRWKEISWIPQGSMSSLDPLQRIDEQAIEIARTHTDLSKEEIRERIERMFDIVGLQKSRVSDYPHQFSGGMQQRALIALALFLKPAVIVADEPTTALDVIMQDQVFKYLDEIKEDHDTSMVLVTHDISVVFESCDKMAIMHAGQVAEVGSVVELFDNPRHPYSILLQEAFPDVRYPDRDLGIIEGNPPQNMGNVDYCTFVDRCPWAVDECRKNSPPLESTSSSTSTEPHLASCLRKEEELKVDRANERSLRGDVS